MDIGGNSAALHVSIDGRGATTGAQQVNQALNSIKQNAAGVANESQKAQGGINRFGSAAAAVTGIVRTLGVAIGGMQLAKMADTYTFLEARTKNATRSLEEFNEAFSGIKRLASETGANLTDTIDVFQRLSFVRSELDATVSDMLTFTGTVQKMGVMSGASTVSMSMGLRQLGQSMSSGTVRAEEFNSIMENIPMVGKAIADQFGVTTGQLRNLVINGLVDSADMFNAVLNESERVTSEYEKMPMTIGRAFSQLTNEFVIFIGEFDRLANVSTIVIGLIDGVRIAVAGLGVAFKSLVSIIGTAANLVLKSIESLANGTIDILNKVIELANKAPGVNLEKFGSIDLTGGAGYGDILNAGKEDLGGIIDTAKTQLPDTIFDRAFQDDIVSTSGKVRTLSKDYKELAKGLSEGKDAKDPRRALKELQEELEMETKAIGLNKDARSDLLKVMEIENELKRNKISLSASERVQLEDDVRRLREMREIASQPDPFYEWGKSLKNVGTSIKQHLVDGFKSASDSLAHFLVTGEGGLKELGDIIENTFEKMLSEDIQRALYGIMGGAPNGSGGGASLFDSIGSFFGGGGGGLTDMFSGVGDFFSGLFSAKGNAFVNGRPVTAFANGGILDRPTFFGMQGGGVGVGGEAGTEAIMPLRRLGNGRLGIEAAGGGGAVFAPTISVVVTGGGDASLAQKIKAEVAEQMDESMKKFNSGKGGGQNQQQSLKAAIDTYGSELLATPNSKMSRSLSAHTTAGRNLGG